MKPFIEAGDQVTVVCAINSAGEDSYSITGKVIRWPSVGQPAAPRMIETPNNVVEIGSYLAAWRALRA